MNDINDGIYDFNISLSTNKTLIYSSYNTFSEACDSRFHFMNDNVIRNFISIGMDEVNPQSIVKIGADSRNDDDEYDFNVFLSNGDEITHSSHNASNIYFQIQQFMTENSLYFISIGSYEVNSLSIVRLEISRNNTDGYDFNVFLSDGDALIYSFYNSFSEAYDGREYFLTNNNWDV